MLEKWRASLDKGGCSGVLLTDLSKSFDCLAHVLLIEKVEAYSFDYNYIKLLNSSLTYRRQRVIINSNYSNLNEIISGVTQGSILGPLLFNMYLSDFFLFTENSDVANYADDNSPYACKADIDSLIEQLEEDSRTLIEWVGYKVFEAILLSNTGGSFALKVDHYEIFNTLRGNFRERVFSRDENFVITRAKISSFFDFARV